MGISFDPMQEWMKKQHISFYRLANEGIDAQTLQRLRHDRPVTTETIGKLCEIMQCQPGDLMEYRSEPKDSQPGVCPNCPAPPCGDSPFVRLFVLFEPVSPLIRFAEKDPFIGSENFSKHFCGFTLR